ncbi:MAG: methyltransferase [Nanoarchaeota archaeon]|nr:methyltransferase [Nanoarchaeota archaeon]
MVYEIIGSKEKAVAIIGFGTENIKELAEKIMKQHKNVKSVLAKTGQREGVFRTHPTKLILGDKNTEVIHKENGYSIKIDPRIAYFSPRESTERLRLSKMIKAGEKILVMFSGVSPIAIAIKKVQPDCKITCIEINPEAVKYADENVKLNKICGIKNICGDVREVKLEKYDRIIMPLPETSLEYLDLAKKHCKGIIHLYGFAKDPKEITSKIEDKIIKIQRVLPYGPGIYKMRFDIEI